MIKKDKEYVLFDGNNNALLYGCILGPVVLSSLEIVYIQQVNFPVFGAF